jgi:thiamine biosynthesis lipoprotein
LSRLIPTNSIGIVAALVLAGCGQDDLREIRLSGLTMGTTYSVKAVVSASDPSDEAELKPEIERLLREISRQMSTYVVDSEISLFNESQSTEPFLVSSEFAGVVQRAIRWSGESGGAFDITILPLLDLWGFGPKQKLPLLTGDLPTKELLQQTLQWVGFEKLSISNDSLVKAHPALKIDLGAIAKGYGVDAVFEWMLARGFDRLMVEIGGEVRASGKNLRGSDWKIGVRKPIPRSGSEGQAVLQWILPLRGQAVATSGDYESFFELDGQVFSHEIDPRTGYPARNGVASVTVVAPNCMDADALATALMVLGLEKGMELIESLGGYEALVVIREQDGLRWQASPGMQLTELGSSSEE